MDHVTLTSDQLIGLGLIVGSVFNLIGLAAGYYAARLDMKKEHHE